MARAEMLKDLPEEVHTYLDEIVARLVDILADKVVGVYLFGSASSGAYEPGLSDIDVQAVVREPLTHDVKQTIVNRLNQQSLPCPARKLELVVYAQSSVATASRHPRFELNLNAGPHEVDHVSHDPASESSHWFLLDIAMGRQLGRCLYGMATSEAFGAVPRAWVLEAIDDSLAWHRAHEPASPNGVLNACRGWRFIDDDVFGSKLQGASWALRQPNCPAVVESAVAARRTGIALDAAEALSLYDIICDRNRIAIQAETGSVLPP